MKSYFLFACRLYTDDGLPATEVRVCLYYACSDETVSTYFRKTSGKEFARGTVTALCQRQQRTGRNDTDEKESGREIRVVDRIHQSSVISAPCEEPFTPYLSTLQPRATIPPMSNSHPDVSVRSLPRDFVQFPAWPRCTLASRRYNRQRTIVRWYGESLETFSH